MTIFFSGIGGSGMSALAILAAARGDRVAGSDRSRDRGLLPGLYASLEKRGIRLLPQDGSGITPEVDRLVVSTAIEATNPDIRAAQELGIGLSTGPSSWRRSSTRGAGLPSAARAGSRRSPA